MNPLRLIGELAMAVGVGMLVFDFLSPADKMGLLAMLVTAMLIVTGGVLVFWSFVLNRPAPPKS